MWVGSRNEFVLQVEGVARFQVSGGTKIIIDPEPGAGDREIRLFLLGSAFGALLHQRGLVPLHGNSIESGEAAAIFLGHSGAGKSTLAHWFEQQGMPVLADDVSAVDMSAAASVLPGVPRLRLWRDAIEAAGLEASRFPRSHPLQDKFEVATTVPALAPRPLGACYLLERGARFSIERLSGHEALNTLVSNTYRGGFVPVLGLSRAHFLKCVRLAREVPVFRATRRWGMPAFAQEAELLRAFMETTLESQKGIAAARRDQGALTAVASQPSR